MIYLKLLKAVLQKKSHVFEVFLKGKKVIDFGCGEGEMLALGNENVIGIEINQTALGRLREKGLNVIESSIESIPMANGSFDVVLCNNIIEHLTVDQAYNMLKEAQRLLRPHGEIIIITPTPKTVWNTFGHVKPYTIPSIMKLFRKNSRESFEALSPMKKTFSLYYGPWTHNKITFLFSTLIANIFRRFAGSYLLVLKKYE